MKSISLILGLALAVTPFAVFADATTQQPAASKVDAGSSFLVTNKAKPGVVSLPDGLQYKVIKAGTGAKPTADDTVTVDYVGSLTDGTVFDSSEKHGQPMTFGVKDVIPGWTEALQLMKEGSTWEIYVPASLAYGATGAPPVIGPNETLIFKITLREVKK